TAASAVVELGRGPKGLDFFKLRGFRDILERSFRQQLKKRPEWRYVELRDQFGTRVARAVSADMAGEAVPVSRWLVVGGHLPGEIRVGISGEAIDQDIAAIRQSLRWKIGVAALLGAVLLSLGLAYVLHLSSKN